MTGSQGEWDAEFNPHRMSLVAYGVAASIAITGVVVAVINNEASGAYLRPADQVAMGGIALLLAGAVLLLTRPRLKVGPSGLAVRNILEYRVIPWVDVVDFSFPPGRRWARVDLAAHEYQPVAAVQLVDRERAVTAMDTVRDLMDRYRGEPH
jgi:hypothetical protein